jgi:hypothetical protein
MIKIISTYSCFGINHEVCTWLSHCTYYDIGKKRMVHMVQIKMAKMKYENEGMGTS